jgi:hypothetical protein
MRALDPARAVPLLGGGDGAGSLNPPSMAGRLRDSAGGSRRGSKVCQRTKTCGDLRFDARERDKLERLYRYIARPAVAERRLSISPLGRVCYQLKTPWKNGTTHIEFEPIDFVAKLAALVPPPRAHLTRFHGIFAPNANLRAQLTPAGRGRRLANDGESTQASSDDRSPEERRRSMSWAQRLKRVFNIDVATSIHCAGAVRIVASIEEPNAIRAILAHFAKHGALEEAHYRPGPRGPPAAAA